MEKFPFHEDKWKQKINYKIEFTTTSVLDINKIPVFTLAIAITVIHLWLTNVYISLYSKNYTD